MQEIILTCAMGVAMLIDVLSDSRDFVRNEVLLLLIHLTKNNTEIQKIIGFQGGFNQLFKVIHSEGYSEGGVVVNDCLQLMLNLLERNSKNQEMFREGNIPENSICGLFHSFFVFQNRVLHEDHDAFLRVVPSIAGRTTEC